MTKLINYSFLLVLNLLSICSSGQNSQDRWTKYADFCIGSKYGITEIWGSPKTVENVYFKEKLPAFFCRRLSFGASDLKNNKLQWVFTGEKGGITIELSNDSLTVLQRNYDSFAFNPFDGKDWKAARYPAKLLVQQSLKLSARVASISIMTTHDLKLQVFINNELFINQLTQIDVSRHQLKMSGIDGNSCGVLEIPQPTVAKVQVNPKIKYQEILGFGGTTSPVTYNMFSEAGKEKWWKYLQEYNFLIQREYPNGKKLKPDYSNWDKVADASAHYYGDNFPNGEISDFSYNKTIQDKGGTVIFEFWQFPDFVIDKTKPLSGEGLTTKVIPLLDKYCEAIINYCKTAKVKTGMAPAIVGIQNELEQPKDVWWNMTIQLRKALDENGFTKTKIHMHNAGFLAKGTEALKAFSENQEVWRKIDFSASNLYDYQRSFTNPDKFDEQIASWNQVLSGKPLKPFLAIEMCVNAPQYQSGSYKIAFLMGELYHKNLTMMNAVALGYCWNLLNTVQPSFEASRSLFAIDEKNGNVPVPSSYQLRVMGAFSRHLPKGVQRIETVSDQNDLLVSAFENKLQKTLILMNRSNKPMSVTIDWSAARFKKIELTDPYNENVERPMENSRTVQIGAGSLITLYQ